MSFINSCLDEIPSIKSHSMNFIPLEYGLSVKNQEFKSYRSQVETTSSGFLDNLSGSLSGSPSGNPSRYLYLMAGVHGDEIEGIYVCQELFNWLKEQTNINLPLIIIPILNIDGHMNNMRVNANGVDLNRNLPSKSWSATYDLPQYFPGPHALSEPENQYLVKLFKQYPPYFIISFHSWKPVINYNGNCEHIAQFLAQYNDYPIASDIGYPTPGSLGDYAPENYNAPVITFECPLIKDGPTLSEIWEQNQKGLKLLLTSPLLREESFDKSFRNQHPHD